MIDKHYQYFWNIKLSVGIMGIILSSMKLAVFTTDPPKSFWKDFLGKKLGLFQGSWSKNYDS